MKNVEQTRDYDRFTFIEGNRIPIKKHIDAIAKSMKTNGMLNSPIIVNEKMEVIDGQHRLLAAKKVGLPINYIISLGYGINEIHALNANQKNWSNLDFMNGYADMGIEPYIILRDFYAKNDTFGLGVCISMVENITNKSNSGRLGNENNNFKAGTWKSGSIKIAQESVDKINLFKELFDGYKKTTFVLSMLSMFRKDEFDVIDFLNKVKLQPRALVDCANIEQAKQMIEEIYNFRRRVKINLRF